ncbi:MAG: class I SAM-dependent methyltransferase [Dehalococcoidia bacterium]
MRREARPVGLDNSSEQLRTARGLRAEFGLSFPLIHGDAEQAPLRGTAFDLAICEYGACLWCDPYRWIPEAARLARPGGRFINLVNATLLTLCASAEDGVPAGDRLLRDYFGLRRLEWGDDGSVEFHLGCGDWIRLLRQHGFDVENLIELRPAEGASTRFPIVTTEWARRWPTEEVWVAHKRD